MDWLSKESMEAWYALLPDDVVSSMERPAPEGQSAADTIAGGITSLRDGASVANFVGENADSFVSLGRARRIRFLAWLAAGDYPDKTAAIRMISDGESSGEASGGIGKVAPYFKEDIRALVEALGPRVARGIVDPATLAAVKGAGYEVSSELEMRSGGAR